MKPLTERELRLAMITVVVVVLGVTWMVVQAQLATLSDLTERTEAAELTRLRQENFIRRRPGLLKEMQKIRGQLPRHPEGQDLKASFARQIQVLAGQSGLTLTSLNPDQEETLPELDLTLSPVSANWEGTPEQLIGFLVRLQQLGPVADVRDLRIRNRTDRKEGIRGSFTLEFVYARVSASDVQPETAPSPAPTEEITSP